MSIYHEISLNEIKVGDILNISSPYGTMRTNYEVVGKSPGYLFAKDEAGEGYEIQFSGPTMWRLYLVSRPKPKRKLVEEFGKLIKVGDVKLLCIDAHEDDLQWRTEGETHLGGRHWHSTEQLEVMDWEEVN